MKLKQQPEDFVVEERTAVAAGEGPFALYRLEKRGWSTPDALAAICRRWHIERRRLSVGGLKDRHAHSLQFFTILHGPRRNLTHDRIQVRYLGQTAEAYTSQHIQANRFRLVLRDLDPGEAPALEQALEALRRQGVPNYFDDQRFGSVCGGGEFAARHLCLGRFEEALKLALTAPYEFDRPAARRQKAILRRHWGDWPRCRDLLAAGHVRHLVAFLCRRPADFRGAIARLHPELRGLYLSAYQSYLWNRMLARWLVEHCRPEQLLPVRLRLGELPLHRDLADEQFQTLAALRLPLPSARLRLDPADPRLPLVHSVLAEEGLELRQLQVKGLRRPFFSKGERAALCQPLELAGALEPDEHHPGRQKLVLAFDLPRGCYATLLVKRIVPASAPR
jgi:tRNA pseudouridine13 synthase